MFVQVVDKIDDHLGYTDTPILDTNTGKDVSYKLSAKDVAEMIVHGLKHDDAVIECNMMFCFHLILIIRYNLMTSFFVRDIPKYARDYLFRLAIPIAKRFGFFTNEYPWIDNIYKEKDESCVCYKQGI